MLERDPPIEGIVGHMTPVQIRDCDPVCHRWFSLPHISHQNQTNKYTLYPSYYLKINKKKQ